MIPTVIETSGRGDRAFDIYSRLLRERIVFLGTQVTDELANSLTELSSVIENEDHLSTEDKQSALEQINIIAEVAHNPEDSRLQKAGKGAIRMLKGIKADGMSTEELIRQALKSNAR